MNQQSPLPKKKQVPSLGGLADERVGVYVVCEMMCLVCFNMIPDSSLEVFFVELIYMRQEEAEI